MSSVHAGVFRTEETLPVHPPEEGTNFVNVGMAERIASVVGGGVMVALGLGKRTVPGAGLALTGSALLFRGVTGHCPVLAQMGRNHASLDGLRTVCRIEERVTVQRPRGELYAFWRDVENLPGFMRHIESVKHISQTHSEWTARAPKDLGTITWEAEVVEDLPGEKITWRSLPGSDIHNAGEVRFMDGPKNETVVEATIEYCAPAGDVGAVAAKWMGATFEHLVREDIRRFKQLMETGVVPAANKPTNGR